MTDEDLTDAIFAARLLLTSINDALLERTRGASDVAFAVNHIRLHAPSFAECEAIIRKIHESAAAVTSLANIVNEVQWTIHELAMVHSCAIVALANVPKG